MTVAPSSGWPPLAALRLSINLTAPPRGCSVPHGSRTRRDAEVRSALFVSI